MVTNMLAASQVHSDKKLVNHSTRKHLVQKLVDNNIAPNEIVQITGHKNINSLDFTLLYLTDDSSTLLQYYPGEGNLLLLLLLRLCQK